MVPDSVDNLDGTTRLDGLAEPSLMAVERNNTDTSQIEGLDSSKVKSTGVEPQKPLPPA